MPILDIPNTSEIVTNSIISADTVNRWRNAAIELDQLSYRTFNGFMSSPKYITATPTRADKDAYPDATKSTDTYRLWRGSIAYRPGMTDLVFEGALTKKKSESLHFYVNGTDKGNVSTNGGFSFTVDISTGYTSGQVLELQVNRVGKTSNTDSDANGGNPTNYKILDVYAGPITGFSSWPGVPTFTTSYSAAQGQQISSACTWLRDRIYAHNMPASIGYFWVPSTHKPETYDMWRGGVLRANADDIFRIIGDCTIYTSAEVVKVYLDGALMETYPSSGVMTRETTHTLDFSIDLSSLTVGTRGELVIQVICTSPSVDDDGNPVTTDSVYNFTQLSTEAATQYPVASAPTALVAGATVTQTTLTSTLNSICTILSAIKSRIDANPNVWNRMYAMRRRPGADTHETNKWRNTYVHEIERRKGTTLFVSGKGSELDWGGIKNTDPDNPYKYEFNQKETLTPDDSYETALTYLTTIVDLQPGTDTTSRA
jgi:hypothetical protein